MNRPARILAAAVVAAVALGLASPAAVAAPPASPGKVDVGGKTGKGSKAANTGEAEAGKKSTKKQSKAERVEKRKQAAFDATLKKAGAAGLSQEIRDALAQSIAADKEALAGADAKELREFDPSRYVQAINYLRKAARLQAEVEVNAVVLASLQEAPAEPTPAGQAPVVAAETGLDLAAALVANEEAAAAVALAIEKAVAITGTSTKADLKAVKAELETAEDALDLVEDFLEEFLDEDEDDGDEDEDEDDEDEDEDEDTNLDQPLTEQPTV